MTVNELIKKLEEAKKLNLGDVDVQVGTCIGMGEWVLGQDLEIRFDVEYGEVCIDVQDGDWA